MRLHARLMILIGIAAGPALGLLVHNQFYSRSNQLAEVHRRAQDLARSGALYNEAMIQGMRRVLIGFGAMLPQFGSDMRLCAEIAQSLNGPVGSATFIGAFDKDGHPLCGNPGTTADLSVCAQTTQASSRQPKARSLPSFDIGTRDGIPVVRLIEPVLRDGEVAGFVAAGLSLEWLTEQISRYPLDEDLAIALVDRNGNVLARRHHAGDWTGDRIPGPVLERMQPHSETSGEMVGADSRARIAAFAPVPAFPDDLFVLIGLDRDAELAAANRSGLQSIVILCLVVLAIIATAIASWETAGRLIRRERRLAEAKIAAERTAAGQQRIADTIGHDLRNATQTLVSFLRNMRRNSGRPPDPAMIPYVARAIGDLRSSLDILIRASRLESGALEPHNRTVQLPAFLRKVANDWQFYAETKGLTLTVATDVESVDTDPELLRTIVSNLVSNAIKHTDAGEVTVSVKSEADGRIAVSVRDTGRGIPPDKADIIFDAFARLEPEKTEGLGLGLSIVKRSADLLGCEITLDRSMERGSWFIVRLPRANGARARSGRALGPD